MSASAARIRRRNIARHEAKIREKLMDAAYRAVRQDSPDLDPVEARRIASSAVDHLIAKHRAKIDTALGR